MSTSLVSRYLVVACRIPMLRQRERLQTSAVSTRTYRAPCSRHRSAVKLGGGRFAAVVHDEDVDPIGGKGLLPDAPEGER
jgi:hypothetical protein